MHAGIKVTHVSIMSSRSSSESSYIVSIVGNQACLAHLLQDKMASILADDNLKCIFVNENDRNLIWFSLKFVPRSPVDNKPSLFQVMTWQQTGDKPLSEPILTQFTDAYIWSTRWRWVLNIISTYMVIALCLCTYHFILVNETTI